MEKIICSICGKKDFDKSEGCAKAKIFTSAVGDWTCNVRGSNLITEPSTHELDFHRVATFEAMRQIDKISRDKPHDILAVITSRASTINVCFDEYSISIYLATFNDFFVGTLRRYEIGLLASEINMEPTQNKDDYLAEVKNCICYIIPDPLPIALNTRGKK